MPTVSILVPTYNGANHIRPAIESVIAQRNVDWELILTDDNSSDGTADIVETYGDSRIRVERNPVNLGPEGNWNKSLSLATGTYIKLLPQDDWIAPGALARQVAALDADRDNTIALAFGAREIINDRGDVLARRGLKSIPAGRVAAPILRRECVRRGTNVIGEPGAVLFRRSLAERIGAFDGQQGYVIDLDYWLRLLAHGDGWYDDTVVSAFRVSRGSWSVAIGGKQAEQYAIFLDRMVAAGLLDPTGRDMFFGKANAAINNILRLVFYKLIVR